MTAQELYRVLQRDHLAPALRGLGLRGSGGSWVLPSPTHWAVLGLQASRSSTRHEALFTVNVQVVERDAWDLLRAEQPSLGPRPNPGVMAGPPAWWERIGLLMPGGLDHWWTVRPGDDPAVVAGQVAAAVAEHALPAMRARMR